MSFQTTANNIALSKLHKTISLIRDNVMYRDNLVAIALREVNHAYIPLDSMTEFQLSAFDDSVFDLLTYKLSNYKINEV